MTELSIQDGILGCYTPSFLQMYLSFSYDGDLNHLSDRDFGTLVHEYIHFLQNTSTPWGLYTSQIVYSSVADVFAQAQQMTNLQLPINKFITTPSKERANILCRKGQGDSYFPWINQHKTDKDKPLKICHPIIIKERDNQCVLTITFEDGQKEDVILGAYIIKESMATMYQSLFDPMAEHDDIPYNIVKIIADDKFPNICNDIRKLISICYVSLFSMNPDIVMFDQMKFAIENPQMSGLDIVTTFIQDKQISERDSKGGQIIMAVTDFYDYVVDSFECVLSKLIGDTPFISESIQRTKISTGFVPIIQILYKAGPLNRETFKTLIDGCGIPHIYTEYGEDHWPQNIQDPTAISNDILQLFAFNAMYRFLTDARPYRICPLLSYCNKKDDAANKGDVWKDECRETPWEGRACLMTVIAKIIGIQDKKVV